MTKINLRISLIVMLPFWRFSACNSDSRSDGLDSLFREIGFSPSCVSQALSSCEKSATEPALVAIRNELQSLRESVNKLNRVQKRARNCAELFSEGDEVSGVRTVYPFSCCVNRPVSVFCDQTTDGGGWTLFQHRMDLPKRENFFRKWAEYQRGFGNLTGEFWLGLDNIHALVRDTLMELRVDLEDFDGKKVWAKYDYFIIEDVAQKYRLDLGKYSGDVEDSLTGHVGQMFSTKDQDNDTYDKNCAMQFRGAWWYSNCHSSNVNGYQYRGNHTSYADGINWSGFRGQYHSLKETKMSLRPKFV